MTVRNAVAYDHRLSKTLALLTQPGLLLAATRRNGESNVMAIGWATVGTAWGRPIFQVMVRPSRYTYELLEESGEFTVNVPTGAMRDWVTVTGTRSGRDFDKIGASGVAVSRGQGVATITLDESPMVYECRVVHRNDVLSPNLDPEIAASAYAGGDYHRVYWGEIVGAYATADY